MTKAIKISFAKTIALIMLLLLAFILTGCFFDDSDDGSDALDLSIEYSNVKLVMNGITGVEYYITAKISNNSKKTKNNLTVYYWYVDASTLAKYSEEKYIGSISGNTTIDFQSYSIIANGVASYGISNITYS